MAHLSRAEVRTLCNLSNSVHDQISRLERLVQPSKVAQITEDTTRGIDLGQSNSYNESIEGIRIELIGKLNAMERLLYEPEEYVKSLAQGSAHDLGTLRAIIKFKMAPAVPLHDSISIEELSAKLQLGPEILRRLAAYSSTYGLFQFSTSQKDRIMHTPFSAVLARGAYAEAAEWDVSIQPYSALMLYDALAKFKNCNGPEEAPFKLAFDTEKNFYLWHRQEKKWGECFRKGMESEQADKRLAPQNCLRALDWRKLDGKTVVDLGGSTGHVAKLIAAAHPTIRFIVQDLPETLAAVTPMPQGSLITFQAHDFFDPQPTVADAYFLRCILHNWDDHNCQRILHALRPALRVGTLLLVSEIIEGHESLWFEKRLFSRRDMQMLSFFGAHERDVTTYDTLVRSTIPQFKYVGCKRPVGSSVGVMEWIYE